MSRPSLTSTELWADLCACATHDRKVQRIKNEMALTREDAEIVLDALAEMAVGRKETEIR
jgi:hypothetical protein